MKYNILLSCSAAAFLVACGGGSGSPQTVSFSELEARGESFLAALGTDNIEDAEPSEFASLPTSGSANFTGIAIVGVEEGPVDPSEEEETIFLAIGATTFVADFDDQNISGTADNFFELSDPNGDSTAPTTGERITGQLTYEFDQVEAGTNNYAGQFVGSLTPTTLSTINVNVAGGGGFAGDDAELFIAEAFDEGDVFVGVLAERD